MSMLILFLFKVKTLKTTSYQKKTIEKVLSHKNVAKFKSTLIKLYLHLN